jgi:hypothetical protein
MSGRKWKRVGSQVVDREITDFDLDDNQGRAIGYEITAFEVSYLELSDDAVSWWPINPPFIARTANLRNGSNFGALSPEIYGDTLEVVMTKARKRRAGALKRQTKNFGSSS